jgi:YggT family protein
MNIGNAFLYAMLRTVYLILDFYIWVLIVGAVLSWLVAFDIINTRSRLVQAVGDIIYRMTEPLLRPIRRVLPSVGGLDLSPMVLIFIIWFLQSFIGHLAL